MDQDQKLLDLLERIEKANSRQVLYAKLQFVFTIVTAIACVALLLGGMKILPQLDHIVTQAEAVLNNLETVTSALAVTDISGMVEDMDDLVANVDALVSSSQTGVEQTMRKINSIDFDALNAAIKDLSDVIEPIAKFFKSFKFG
jgi:hypothetical protein